MRVLIVKTSSMGDVIHALPLLADLRAALPAAEVHWVVEEGFAPLLRLHPVPARVIPVALRRWRRQLGRAATWRELRAWRAAMRAVPYDAIVDCQGLLKSAWIARRARGPVAGLDRDSAREPLAARCYDRRVAVPRTLHAIERNRRVAGAALGYPVAGAPRFGLRAGGPVDAAVAAALRGEPYAVLLSNASRASKRWPDERWAAVGAGLATTGLRSVLFAGSAAERAASAARAAAIPGAVLAPALPLDAIAAVLAGAAVVVGLDTGLTHLAAALGVPAVGIYCDYDPALVGLVGDGPVESLGGVGQPPAADAVAAAVARVRAAARTPASAPADRERSA